MAKFLEIETKYDASDIDRIKFKNLLKYQKEKPRL